MEFMNTDDILWHWALLSFLLRFQQQFVCNGNLCQINIRYRISVSWNKRSVQETKNQVLVSYNRFLGHIVAQNLCCQNTSLLSPLMSLVKSSVSRIVGSNAHLMICDIQERFRPLIHQMDPVINRAVLLNKACNTLEIPTLITEQYPKVFGNTVTEISAFPGTQVFAKKQFSMISPEISALLKESGRNQVIWMWISCICKVVLADDVLLF